MVLLLSLRSLPTHGDDHQLAFRLTVHDLSHRTDLNTAPPRMHTPTPSEQSSPELSVSAPSSNSPLNADCYHPHTPPSETPPPPPPPSSSPHHDLPRLPLELWADIFENVGDWELATALGVHSNLRPTADWTRHATPLDCALLSGSVPRVAQFLSEHPHATFTRFGAKALIRFAYTDLLSLLRARRPQDFLAVFSQLSCRIPELASRFGQTKVLSWWLAASSPSATPSPSDGEDDASASPRLPPLPRDYDSEPLDEASRKGHIHVLQWWKTSGLPLRYGLAMDVASAWGQPAVLEWWKNSGLPLEYDRNALRSASYRGEVGVLEWWKRSGLRLIYDKDVLVEATKFNRVEVLEWWKHSGLTVHYLLIEIEAALEDAIGGGKEAMEWWKGNGARFDVAVREWTEEKTL